MVRGVQTKDEEWAGAKHFWLQSRGTVTTSAIIQACRGSWLNNWLTAATSLIGTQASSKDPDGCWVKPRRENLLPASGKRSWRFPQKCQEFNEGYSPNLLQSPELLALVGDGNNLFFTHGALWSSVTQFPKELGPILQELLRMSIHPLKGCNWRGGKGTWGHRLGSKFWLCHLPAVWLWESNLNSEPQFPHLSYDLLEGHMEKHSSFHLYFGNRVLAEEINTYSTNSAALLGNTNRLHKCDSPGSSEERYALALHRALVWPACWGSQERTAAGSLVHT